MINVRFCSERVEEAADVDHVDGDTTDTFSAAEECSRQVSFYHCLPAFQRDILCGARKLTTSVIHQKIYLLKFIQSFFHHFTNLIKSTEKEVYIKIREEKNMIECSKMLLFVYFYGWSAFIIKKLCLLDFFYFSVPNSQSFIQPDKPPVISRMGMPIVYRPSVYSRPRPKKKYCLLPISDRLYQNMCDPNLFYGFFFFFFRKSISSGMSYRL